MDINLLIQLFQGTWLGSLFFERLCNLVGQRDMRERRLLTHELAAVGVPEEAIRKQSCGVGMGGETVQSLSLHKRFQL